MDIFCWVKKTQTLYPLHCILSKSNEGKEHIEQYGKELIEHING